MVDDATLLRRYAEDRAEDAFNELVRRHLDFVYSAAHRRTSGDAHRAADVAQIVFASLAREARQLSRRAVLTGWLYTATRNAALNVLRAERRRRSYEQQAADAMTTDLSGTAAAVDWEKLRPMLDSVMDELPASDREAVLLRFFEQRPFAKIGAALTLSEDAARMRVDRALEKLRVRLARHGITSTASALGVLLANQAVASAPAGLFQVVVGSALASAGTIVAPVFSIFQIMSTTKVVISGAAVVLALSLGGVLYEVDQASQARRALVTAVGERDRLQQRVSDLEARAGNPAAQTATSQKPIVAPGPNPTAAVSVAGGASTAAAQVPPNAIQPANPLGTLYALRNSPEAMEAWLLAERSGLDLQLGPLFRTLGLSAGQIERFKTLLMEKFQTVTDVTAAAQAQGVAMSDPTIRAAFKEATDKAENGFRALLGESGYEQLREYGATSKVREIVRSLASDVYYSDRPLDAASADRLVQVIATHSAQDSSGYTLNATNWSEVFAAAGAFLSSNQITMLRAEADQVLLRQQLDRLAKPARPPGG